MQVWQSNSRSNVVPLLRPAQTRRISLDKRPFARCVSDGSARACGLKLSGRSRTRQPLHWTTRCNVFLLNSSKCATVLNPNDGLYTVIALIWNTKRFGSLYADFTGR